MKFRVENGRLLYQNGSDCGTVYQEVDGYYVWWPENNAGCWEAAPLRAIADLLDEMNQPWDDEVQAFFAQDKDA